MCYNRICLQVGLFDYTTELSCPDTASIARAAASASSAPMSPIGSNPPKSPSNMGVLALAAGSGLVSFEHKASARAQDISSAVSTLRGMSPSPSDDLTDTEENQIPNQRGTGIGKQESIVELSSIGTQSCDKLIFIDFFCLFPLGECNENLSEELAKLMKDGKWQKHHRLGLLLTLRRELSAQSSFSSSIVSSVMSSPATPLGSGLVGQMVSPGSVGSGASHETAVSSNTTDGWGNHGASKNRLTGASAPVFSKGGYGRSWGAGSGTHKATGSLGAFEGSSPLVHQMSASSTPSRQPPSRVGAQSSDTWGIANGQSMSVRDDFLYGLVMFIPCSYFLTTFADLRFCAIQFQLRERKM